MTNAHSRITSGSSLPCLLLKSSYCRLYFTSLAWWKEYGSLTAAEQSGGVQKRKPAKLTALNPTD